MIGGAVIVVMYCCLLWRIKNGSKLCWLAGVITIFIVVNLCIILLGYVNYEKLVEHKHIGPLQIALYEVGFACIFFF